MSRATAARRHSDAEPVQLPTPDSSGAPGNKLTPAERTEVLHVPQLLMAGLLNNRRCSELNFSS